ncbi:cytidylate kinase-like family protein [Muricomes sp. OA1]|uniref:Cytidylate kinase-like family protein n=1 Tax=Hungatella hathewayi TaxID=154046 RepID=A0A3E2WIM3_9FIRM|nr:MULTISPECIES: cytidylate kinase-like family protein [Clostridia]MEE0200131.1 cytidylate kinase-like family protein [Muricomes sp.]MCH1973145.1 cytidylate kinase-like family protein [Muricomes sp. OA1]MRM90394.1 cytidylate kinase-like family protein [Faecalicatena contorta]RGC26863.1 cytidylate kinase-like family protein [Hungatella hathewayi]GKH31926.1 cytidylate kinase [Faecalicatena contorta]
MTDHTIITIGRQFGSGGHEIGNRLAERLDIPLYDHNLIRMAAKELKVSDEEASRVDETILGRFLSAYVVGTGDYTAFMSQEAYGVPLSDRMYETQTKIIKKLAAQSSCIFVGRCADYVLGDYTNCINIFIHAFKDDRIRRIMNIYKLTERQAWDKIKKVDKERRLYYEAHTGREWGSSESHEILFNASLLGVDGVVDAMEAIYKTWEGRKR